MSFEKEINIKLVVKGPSIFVKLLKAAMDVKEKKHDF